MQYNWKLPEKGRQKKRLIKVDNDRRDRTLNTT